MNKNALTKYILKSQLLNELKKGYFGLGKYISLNGEQQEDLLRTIDLLKNYINRENPKRPFNIFIQAPSGYGKSFLVKEISNTLGETLKQNVRYYNFNLSFMESPNDLLKAFRKVQSANINRVTPVVFFDEIDGRLRDFENAYRFFLTPMFDGVIYDSGEEFSIGKAIFIFAASKPIEKLIGHIDDKEKFLEDETDEARPYIDWTTSRKENVRKIIANQEKVKTEKLVDFLTRIDSFIFLPSFKILFYNDRKGAKLQALLIIMAMLCYHFPNIEEIDNTALILLSNAFLEMDNFRRMDSYIFKSTNPIDGKFRSENLPTSFREKYREEEKRIEAVKSK